MDSASIVVPAATPASSVAFHRSLGRRGFRTIAISEDESVPSFRSRYCDETVLVTDPWEDLTGYKHDLLALAMRPDVETIVPLREEDIYVLSKYRTEFGEHVSTPWPSFETLRIAQDREKLFEAAREVDVSVPRTRTLDGFDEWDQKLVIKSRYALLVGEFLPERSEAGLIEAEGARFLEPGERPDVESLRSAFKHIPHVQRYVEGPEYSLGVLYDDGGPVVETQKRVVRGVKYYHGPSVYHESVNIPELETLGRQLLRQIDYHGPADIDVVLDEATGEYMLLEINPRFWATVQAEIHAGFDFPYYYWQMSRGETVGPIPSPRAGISSHFLPGELSYLLSVLSDDHPLSERPSVTTSAWQVARSIVEERRYDLLGLDDPLPFVSLMANKLTSSHP